MKQLYTLFLFISVTVSTTVNAQIDPQLQWVLNTENTSIEGGFTTGNGIAVDASGNRYITGYFDKTADFDPSAATANLTSLGSFDIYIAKYDPNGNYLWAKNIGNTGDDRANAIALDNAGQFYIIGNFKSTVDFNPSAGADNLTSVGALDGFIAKYDTNGNYIWAKSISGNASISLSSIALDSSNQIHITGHHNNTVDFDPSGATANLTAVAGGTDSFIAKYDTNGNYLWAKNIGGNNFDYAYSIAVNSSGQVHITGVFSGTADFDPSGAAANLTALSTNSDIFIAKYDTNGNYIWAKAIGGNNTDSSNAIALDSSGQIHITGYFNDTADFNPAAAVNNLTSAVAGVQDIFIAKYDTNGNYLWAKTISGNSIEKSNSIAINSSGQVHISGSFYATVDFDPSVATANLTSTGNNDIFIAKYDSNGNYLWAKNCGGANDDVANAIVVDTNDKIFFTGFFRDTVDFDASVSVSNLTAGFGNANCFMACYSATGTFNNAQVIGGYSNQIFAEIGKSITTDNQGNVYVTGTFNGATDFDPSAATALLTPISSNQDIFIAKYNSNGNYLWAKSIGGNNAKYVNSIKLDNNGQVLITGTFVGAADFDPSAATATLTPVGSSDIYLAKYDTNGNYLWAKNMGGVSNDEATSIALDNNGQIYLSGFFFNSADFDPSPATANLTSAGGYDSFIAKYDANGNYLWAKNISGTSDEYSISMALDNNNQIHITGTFIGTTDFDPSGAVANLTSVSGNSDVFIAKYDSNGNYIWAKNIGGSGPEVVRSIALNSTGQIHITGTFQNTADFDPSGGNANLSAVGARDIYIAKYDINGNYLWAKGMGGTSTDEAMSLSLDTSGRPHITGYFQGTADFDPSPVAVANLTSASGSIDIFIAKYDVNGNYIWAKAIGSLNVDSANAIALDRNNKVHITGYFNNTVDFDTSGATSYSTALNNMDVYLAQYTSCTTANTSITRNGMTLTADSTADSYQWIDCSNNNAFIPGANNQSYTPTVDGNYAVILTVGSCDSVSECQAVLGTEENQLETVVLYPNPVTNHFFISLPHIFESSEVTVTNLLGKIIKKTNYKQQQQINISLEDTASGIYFVRLEGEQKTKIFKVIKQ
ncbi:T9SS type A sorting domain-containing protein [Flavobacterium sp. GCM10027622]|uniref:T9SS type A sorting domain-containing protein n=1 Tax=unclassified Flavobacterium TaxID=196869 RepID=UPI003618B6D7